MEPRWNPDGSWDFGFSGHIVVGVLKAKLIGIFNGLKLVWGRGYTKLICYIDSPHAKNLIAEQRELYHSYASIVQDIQDLLNILWHVELLHILREGNQCADHLAKLETGNDVHLKIWERPPMETNLCPARDAVGVSFPRGYPRL